MGVAVDGGGGDDALLLREFAHRTANALAVAVAAVDAARRADAARGGRFLSEAAGRLRLLGDLHRLLARPVPQAVDVAGELEALCTAMHASRVGPACGLSLDLGAAWVDGVTARRLSLVAVELVENAFRHALDGAAGELAVTLRREPGALVLVVANGAPPRGGRPSPGTGLGRGIVSELVGRAGGVIDVCHRDEGTVVRVEFPMPDGGARDAA